MKKIYIVGNWKLNLTLAENQKLAEDLKQLFMSGNYQTLNSTVGEKIEVVLAPQFPALSFVSEILKNSPIELAAQNSCFETKGAYTGETSPVLLKELGCRYCIIGHSERRHIFKESDEMIGKKFFTLSSLGIIPIFCVGETLEQREQNQLQTVIERQLQPILEKAEILEKTPLVIAYEPVWAIGTGLTANQEQVAEDSGFNHILAQVDPLKWQQQLNLFHNVVRLSKLGVAYENTQNAKSYAALDSVLKVAKKKGFQVKRCTAPSDIPDVELAYPKLLQCHKRLAREVDAMFITDHGGFSGKAGIKPLLAPFVKAKIPTLHRVYH